MPDKYLIGIDIGTQGTKTSIFDLDGKALVESFEASNLISPTQGVVEQNPNEIYSSVINTIRDVVEKSGVAPGSISAIGIDGQMAGILGIDGQWNAVTPYDSWLDTRCEKYIAQIKARDEETVIKITGCPVTYAHGPKVLWWKNERPAQYQKIEQFIQPSGYVAGRLAGLKADSGFEDYTTLHFSGFGDVLKNEWSDQLLDMFGVEKKKMPRIVNPWDVIGHLTKSEAAKCGLLEGTAIVAGCGDQSATSLGAGVTRKGTAFDVAGTASVFSCCVDTYSPDIKNKTLLFPHSVIPGLWQPMAYTNGSGLCIKWFRDHFTGDDNMADYKVLDAEAAKVVPGSEGLVFVPHFAGRVCPNNPNVRGSWVGLHWGHTRAHLYRAIMEGIAYEYSLYLNILKELLSGVSVSQVLAIGGGAKSRVFNQIKADVLGTQYVSLKNVDTATLGSAVVAGYGVGLYSDLASVMDGIIQKGETIQPNAGNYDKYSNYSDIYAGLFDQLGSSFQKLIEAGELS